MPFDGARWAIELAAVDKTAQAFSSVERRMKSLSTAQAGLKVDAAGQSAMGVMALAKGLGVVALGYMAVAKAKEIWNRAAKAGDLGEQAEQIGVNTDQLQAYRFAGAQAGIETEAMDVALTKLAKSAGTAADGNKEMIDRFQQLGVKLLDAKGELRPVADLLPEVARGVLNIGSSSQRTATLMELFGRSGAKMATVLEEVAKGNDSVVGTAKAAGAVLDTDIIQAWENFSDSLKRAELTADVTYAKLGAPIATTALDQIDKVLKSINGTMDQINSKEGFWASVLAESREKGRMGGLRLETPAEIAERRRQELQAELRNPNNAGREAMIQADIDRLNQAAAQQDMAQLGGIQGRGAATPFSSRFFPGPAPSVGARNPVPKGTGDAAAKTYQSVIESAKDYTAQKKAETAAIGLNVEQAARLKHEQELLNKASSDANQLTPAQIANLKGLAAGMAAADAEFAKATFMDDMNSKAKEFIATQEIERATLYMSQEAAMAYRLEHEALNAAKAKGIELGPQEVAQIKEIAAAQAAVADATRKAKEWADFEKDTMKGFVSDVTHGLREGATVWDAFGKAGENALGRIADKLMDMALDDLFANAFGGKGGGGGGILGSIVGWIGGALGGAAGGGLGGGSGMTFATGGQTPMGVPYLVGERGPEVRIDGRPGQIFNRGQWGAMGGSGGGQAQRIEILLVDDMLDARIANGANVQITRREPKTVAKSVRQSTRLAPAAVAQHPNQREGEWRTAGA